MILHKFTKSALILGFITVFSASPMMADEFLVSVSAVSPEEHINTIQKISSAITRASSSAVSAVTAVPGQCAGAVYSAASTVAKIPGTCANFAYQETLGKHPGKCMLLMGAAFCGYLAREQYKKWHNAKATTRRTILGKIQKAYDDYKACGNTVWGNVHNQQQLSVVQSLAERKTEILNDASRVYNWGMLQDTKLSYLIEEFFAVLAKETSGNQLPAAAVAQAAQPYWFQFWKHSQPEKRHLEDILVDIKDCLCGASF